MAEGNASSDILIIDDDPYYFSFAFNLLGGHRGYNITRAQSVDEALGLVQQKCFPLIIVDLRMPPGEAFRHVDTAGGHKTGILLAQEIRKYCPDTRFIVHTGGADTEAEALFENDPNVVFLYKSPDFHPLLRAVEQSLAPDNRRLTPFIVHGRDNATLLALKNYLQNRLGMGEPMVLWELPSHGRTIIEKFEYYAAKADFVFVLMTPDDYGSFKSETKRQSRARQNVIFELGYFLGYLRRRSGRIFLLHSGDIEIPSDLSGVIYIDISNGIETAGETIRGELSHRRIAKV
jgi:predicted nucleotide-binding protein